MSLESFAYMRPGQSGVFSVTLRGEEVVTSGADQGKGLPIALSRIGEATITLQDEATGEYINGRGPGGAKHVIVQDGSPGAVLGSADVTIDPTSGACAWRIQPEDTAVSGSVDVAEYVATLFFRYADAATPNTFDRTLYAYHRIRIPKRPTLCVPADVFRVWTGKASEQQLPLVEFLCEAVTDRFETEIGRLVGFEENHRELIYVGDDCTWALQVKRWPLRQVVSVKESTSGDDSPGAFATIAPIPPSDYRVINETRMGLVRMRHRPFQFDSVVEIIAHAGLARSTGDVPPHLRNLCARQVAFMWQRATDLGVSSVQAKDATAQVIAQDLLEDVRKGWELYRALVF